MVPLDTDIQCTWDSTDQERSLSVAAYADRDLLVDTYRTRLMRIFRPGEIAGLPVVDQRTSENDLSCVITTGIAPGQALETTWYEYALRDGRPVNDPCVSAKQVVEAVVGNLPSLR